MKKIILGFVVAACLSFPVAARNLAVPAKNPAITLSIPDKWKVEEIEFGYSAKSPDGDVFFSVESASKSRIDAMMKNNAEWMKDNKINDKVTPEKLTFKLNGADVDAYQYNTTDENGPTKVEFYLMAGGHNTVIMVTLWANDAERKANDTAIDALMNSIKPIN